MYLRSRDRMLTPESFPHRADAQWIVLHAGSVPERLGSFTFGSGSVRRASDGRCHFTITTGNTRPGPDAMPLAQEVRISRPDMPACSSNTPKALCTAVDRSNPRIVLGVAVQVSCDKPWAKRMDPMIGSGTW